MQLANALCRSGELVRGVQRMRLMVIWAFTPILAFPLERGKGYDTSPPGRLMESARLRGARGSGPALPGVVDRGGRPPGFAGASTRGAGESLPLVGQFRLLGPDGFASGPPRRSRACHSAPLSRAHQPACARAPRRSWTSAWWEVSGRLSQGNRPASIEPPARLEPAVRHARNETIRFEPLHAQFFEQPQDALGPGMVEVVDSDHAGVPWRW